MSIVYEFFTVTIDPAGWSVIVPVIRELWDMSSSTMVPIVVVGTTLCITIGILIRAALRSQPEQTEDETIAEYARGFIKALGESPTFQSMGKRRRRAIEFAVRERIEASGSFESPEGVARRMTSRVLRVSSSQWDTLAREIWPLLRTNVDVRAFLRPLPPGVKASMRAHRLALEAGIDELPEGVTFVSGHERAALIRQKPL